MALTVTAAGGLALLAGVIVLGQIVGSFQLDTVLVSGERIRAHPLYPAALVLILLGAFSKSAQFPLPAALGTGVASVTSGAAAPFGPRPHPFALEGGHPAFLVDDGSRRLGRAP
jgi:multicomponent K+:H+ antiporter subunit A